MNKPILLFLLLWSSIVTFAQPVNTLTDSTTIQIKNYTVLPDLGYSFQGVLSDTSLPFIVNDSLRPVAASAYWLKVIIASPFHYARLYNVQAQPNVNNTLYYLNADAQKWVSNQAGHMQLLDKSRNQGTMPCVLQGQTKNILYIRVVVAPFKQFGYALAPAIYLEKQASTNQYEQLIWISWLITLTVLLLFIVNNSYIYFSFRDRAVRHYLIAQLGAVVYITSNKAFFHVLFANHLFIIKLYPNGGTAYYDIDFLLNHIAVLLIMYGTVQMTRSYLNTKTTLPKLDAVLAKGLFGYLLVAVVLILINTCWFFIDVYTLLYDNILVLLLIAVIIGTSMVAYKRKLPSAKTFLLANILPLCIIVAISLYHVFVSYNDTSALLLPDLAISTQAISFSIALVARIKLIRYDLAAKEKQAQRLMFEIREMEFRHQLIELENKKTNADIDQQKIRNELLQERLEANQRELASTTLYVVQKNEMLAGLKTQLQELDKLYPNNKQHGLQGIESLLQSNLYLDADWAKFRLHFEQVHPQFFGELQAKHPSLTKNETRLYAYFHINLSTKEIAALLNIDPASVRRAKTRLHKKMAMGEADNPL